MPTEKDRRAAQRIIDYLPVCVPHDVSDIDEIIAMSGKTPSKGVYNALYEILYGGGATISFQDIG